MTTLPDPPPLHQADDLIGTIRDAAAHWDARSGR